MTVDSLAGVVRGEGELRGRSVFRCEHALHDKKNGVSGRQRAPPTKNNQNFARGERSYFVRNVVQQERQGGFDLN